jgi:hypothetical protein
LAQLYQAVNPQANKSIFSHTPQVLLPSKDLRINRATIRMRKAL